MGRSCHVVWVVLLLCAGGCGDDTSSSKPPSQTTLPAEPSAPPNSFLPHSDQRIPSRLKRAVARLAERGWRLDVERCTIEVVSYDAMEEEWAKASRLEDPLGEEGRELFRRGILHIVRTLGDGTASGVYLPGTGRILLLDAGFADPLTADAVIAHEAVHAFQDQAGRLDLRVGGPTTEARALNLALIEGEAELGRIAAMAATHGGSPVSLPVDELDLIHGQGVLANDVGAFYVDGLLHFLRRGRDATEASAARVLAERPASAEQFLHASKFGVDEPVRFELPERGHADGWKRVGMDTLGELQLRSWLALFESQPRARVLACGWDGDTVAVYEHPTHGRVVVWVLLWDREEDADQFHRVVEQWTPAGMQRNGRVVIMAAGGAPRQRIPLLEWAARTVVQPAQDPEGVRTTAAIEAAWQARSKDPQVDAGWWKLPAIGLSVPVADDWFQELEAGMTSLRATSSRKYAWPAIYLDTVLLGRPLRLDEARARFDALANGGSHERVLKHERVTLHGGREAVLVHHAVGIGSVWLPEQLLSLYIPTPWGALVVRGRVHHDDHDKRWPEVRASLLATRYDPTTR